MVYPLGPRPRRAGWGVSGDHRDDRGRPDLDRDGVPLSTEPPGELAEVFPLHPPTGDHGLGLPTAGRGGLLVEDLGVVLDRVDHAGPPGWLIQGLWPADAYGVLAAEDKAGKTWAVLDLAVSVAAGRPWLGAFSCPQAGRVLVFLGEGDQRAVVRRLRAICAHKGLQVEELAARIRLCFRVPRLTSGEDLAAVAAELAACPAALVILDPLYLAVGTAGAGADLYAMGTVLSAIQGVCQRAGAALVVVTHWNKTGEGRGAKRISGVGPGAWGRVLCSAAVAHRSTSPEGASAVVLAFEVIGGELADTAFRVRRRVWAEDPADLASSLHYTVEVLADEPPAGDDAGNSRELLPSRRLVLAALRAGGPMQSVKQLGDHTAAQGHQLRKRTIQEALTELEERGLVVGTDAASGLARYWSPTSRPDAGEHPDEGDER
jgi:AAA domain-containing protein